MVARHARPVPRSAAPSRSRRRRRAGLLDALRLALRDRTLLLWLGATALCDLLDEILVVFASLHLRDDLGAGPTERAIVLAASVVGGAIGVLVVDRLLRRHAPLRILTVCAAACGATYLLWMAAPNWWLSAIGMLLVGATSSPLYPIAQAQCYAALPGRSGAVNAALLVLTVQPVGPAVIALNRSVQAPEQHRP